MTSDVSIIRYRVPYADTDKMGVVYYANYLVYFERLRTRLMEDLGLPYPELEQRGFAMPVVEAHVSYRAGAGYDDELEIRGRLAWVKGARLRVDCEVWRGEQLLAEGYTVHACVAMATGRPVRIPRELARKVQPES